MLGVGAAMIYAVVIFAMMQVKCQQSQALNLQSAMTLPLQLQQHNLYQAQQVIKHFLSAFQCCKFLALCSREIASGSLCLGRKYTIKQHASMQTTDCQQ